MNIPHWLIGLAIFAGVGSFIVFTFRQGQQVKPDDRQYQGPSVGGGG
jgi:hypothetical protein